VGDTVVGNMPEVTGAPTQNFAISTNRATYSPSTSDQSPSNVIVTICGATFNGFLLYAERNNGVRHGSWTTTGGGQTTSGSLPAPCGGTGNTLTHSDTTTKGGGGIAACTTPYTAIWTAPSQSVGGNIVFKALIMVSGSPRLLTTVTSTALNEQITVPLAPYNIVAQKRWKCVIVSFTVEDGGSQITFIDVRSSADPAARANGTASPIQICGLRNGVATTITITARNAIGNGAGASSATVTPGCFCYGHSQNCTASGSCDNCQGNTMGTLCETCVAGYTGDPTIEACSVIRPPNPGSAAHVEVSVAILFSTCLLAIMQLFRA